MSTITQSQKQKAAVGALIVTTAALSVALAWFMMEAHAAGLITYQQGALALATGGTIGVALWKSRFGVF